MLFKWVLRWDDGGKWDSKKHGKSSYFKLGEFFYYFLGT